MIRRLVILGALPVTLLSACAQPVTVAGVAGTTSPAAVPDAPDLPDAPKPESAEPCPYLDAEFVAQANGQRVSTVEISEASQGPHPSCFFVRPDGSRQLTVRVYVGDRTVAMCLVDQAAPIEESNPADQPAGWNGGYQVTATRAVYAVAKANAAVMVTTNQPQTIKARRVAEQVISTLGL